MPLSSGALDERTPFVAIASPLDRAHRPRLHRAAFAATTAAIAAALVLAPSAQAATPGMVYLDDSDFATGDNTTSLEGWSHTGGDTPVSGLSGLDLGVLTAIELGFDATFATSPTDLVELGTTLKLGQVTGAPQVRPRIAVLEDSTDGTTFTMISSPVALPASAEPTAVWSVFDGFGALAPGAYTLDVLQAEAETLPNFAIVTIDFVNSGPAITVSDLFVDDQQYIFTPEPVFTAPTTITASDFEGDGITISTTGFLPGEDVEIYISSPDAGGPNGTITADDSGAITYTFVNTFGETPLGGWQLVFVGDVPNPQFFLFEVTGAELAATGADTAGAAVLAGGLLVAGIAVVAGVARRQRVTAD